MLDTKEYAKGMLHELQEGADGISGFVDAFRSFSIFTDEEWQALECANERANGFAEGFKCCLEMWPAPMKKEAAND